MFFKLHLARKRWICNRDIIRDQADVSPRHVTSLLNHQDSETKKKANTKESKYANEINNYEVKNNTAASYSRLWLNRRQFFKMKKIPRTGNPATGIR